MHHVSWKIYRTKFSSPIFLCFICEVLALVKEASKHQEALKYKNFFISQDPRTGLTENSNFIFNGFIIIVQYNVNFNCLICLATSHNKIIWFFCFISCFSFDLNRKMNTKCLSFMLWNAWCATCNVWCIMECILDPTYQFILSGSFFQSIFDSFCFVFPGWEEYSLCHLN